MKQTDTNPRRIRHIGWWIAGAILLLMLAVTVIYLSDYYHADAEAWQAIASTDTIQVIIDTHSIVFVPAHPVAGLIFYPGGKVETEAYAPLMRKLAERDILCVLLQMPGHLAVFAPNAADGVQERFPEVQRWLIGGHSLGGVIASGYVAKHSSTFSGVVLLGSYTTADLNGTVLDVLSLYGTNDNVLNRDAYQKNHSNLPDDTVEKIIDGGCHAWFGNYGEQAGDGVASITHEEQQRITADAIADLLQKEESK